MKLSEIMTLLNAGYTKAEIDALDHSDPAPDPAPAAAVDPEPEPAPAQPEEPIQGTDQYAALEAKLNKLMGLVQTQNLNQGVSTMPGRTAQDALAEIIAPPRKETK